MPNPLKAGIIETLRARFGELHKVGGSQSLFTLGENAARIYFRYSKIHPGGRTFFGLRDADLRQLEGHNAFICFLRDDASEPLFVPYADFEEVFRSGQPAKDGQYKVQLLSGRGALELYIARQGRFNVEGYVGFPMLARSLDARRLREARDLSHSQVQTLLAAIGHIKGYEVCVPENDAGKLDWSLTRRFPLREGIPTRYGHIGGILSEIDIVWLGAEREAIEGLFEVEHSTPVYSGLLRFNDVLLADPSVSRFSVASKNGRRALFSRQLNRPTFRKSGLAELVTFLEYANVLDWHARLAKGESRAEKTRRRANIHGS